MLFIISNSTILRCALVRAHLPWSVANSLVDSSQESQCYRLPRREPFFPGAFDTVFGLAVKTPTRS